MKKHLFPENGKFYKANMHCHTVLSDGNLTAQEVKEAYLAHGYSVVAFTDHEALLDHSDLTDERFIALNGYETAIKQINGVSTLKATAMPVHHINFIKKKPMTPFSFAYSPAISHRDIAKNTFRFFPTLARSANMNTLPTFSST